MEQVWIIDFLFQNWIFIKSFLLIHKINCDNKYPREKKHFKSKSYYELPDLKHYIYIVLIEMIKVFSCFSWYLMNDKYKYKKV